ncbi:hypothetical protein ACFE04_022055 [Oxalis oulophora]
MLTAANSSKCWLPSPAATATATATAAAGTNANVLLPYRQVSVFIGLLRFDRSYLVSQRCCRPMLEKIRAMDASSFDDSTQGQNAIFPRINVRDPYKRLGIRKEAGEEEIQAARKFLVQKYAGHKKSVDAIEEAHSKIIMQQFYDRKNPKIDVQKKVREFRQSKFIHAITSRFRTPSTLFIVKTALAFLVLGVLTVLYPTEDGPTLQVAVSLMAAVYFIYDRLKSKIRAFVYGAGAFTFSWLIGTFLMVCLVPPMVKGIRGFEEQEPNFFRANDILVWQFCVDMLYKD